MSTAPNPACSGPASPTCWARRICWGRRTVIGMDRPEPPHLWASGRAPTTGTSSPPAAHGITALPLDDLRIADFTALWAGPLVTHILGTLGADVVKVESVQRPDAIRYTSAQGPQVDQWWEYSWLFHGVNAGKKSVTLDLTRPEGLRLAGHLIENADIVIENFSPRVFESFGFDEDHVRRLAPQAVFVRMPAFGLRGPWRERVGLAQTMEQLSGLANITGYADGPPTNPRGPCDAIAGMHAAFAALVAIVDRDRTGRGQLVESVMVNAALERGGRTGDRVLDPRHRAVPQREPQPARTSAGGVRLRR